MRKSFFLFFLMMFTLCAEANTGTPFETVAKKLRSISLDPRNSRFELFAGFRDSGKWIEINFSGFGTSKELTTDNRPSLACRIETRST